MPITLIYHRLDDNAADNISPFDKAIVNMVTGQDMKIACPYLSVNYLERLFSLCGTWKILADVEAWITSHQHKSKRDELVEFISENSSQIRHLKKLHAKVISAGDSTLIGSANFTIAGIQKRTEMSILFQNEPQVSEINSWFDLLWNQAASLNIEEVYEYESSSRILKPNIQHHQKRLTSHIPNIQSELINLEIVEDIVEDITEKDFFTDNTENELVTEDETEDEENDDDISSIEDTDYGSENPAKYRKNVHAFHLIPKAKEKFFVLNSKPVAFNFNWMTQQDYPECIKNREEYLTTKYCAECTFYSLYECPIMADPSIISGIRAFFNQKEREKEEHIENQKNVINLIYDELKNLGKSIHYIQLTKNLAQQYPGLKLTPSKVLRTMNWYPQKFERVEKGIYKVNL